VIEDLVAALVAAWNDGDTPRFAALFTESAEYVTGNGLLVQGRDAIAKLLPSDQRVKVAIERRPSVRAYDGVASVMFPWRSDDSARHGIVTLVAVQRGSSWLIDRLQNTDGE